VYFMTDLLCQMYGREVCYNLLALSQLTGKQPGCSSVESAMQSA